MGCLRMIPIQSRIPVRHSSRAFTLVEVMVVVAIAGVLMVSAMAPMIYTVELLRNLQRDYAKTNRERFAVERIFRDARTVISAGLAHSFEIQKGRALLLWSQAPVFERLPAGCVVFAVVPQGRAPEGKNGLYRWILPSEKSLEEVKPEELDPARGVLLLEGVEEASFSAWKEDAWIEEYQGGVPAALSLNLRVKERTISRVDRFPKIL